MPNIEEYDFEILEYIASSDSPVYMADIFREFGEAGVSAASALYKDKMIRWYGCLSSSIPSLDDTHMVCLTKYGILERSRYEKVQHLTAAEKRRCFFFGVLSTLVSEVLLLLVAFLAERISSALT